MVMLLLGAVAAGLFLSFHPARPLYLCQKGIEIVSADGTKLAGTLSLPRWASTPLPAIAIVHGSGPLPLEHLLDDTRQLAWEGLRVLAYDKRGVGAWQGEYPRGGGPSFGIALRLLAQDAAAALDRLRREPEVDASRSGLFGASQPGRLDRSSGGRATRIQTKVPDLAFRTGCFDGGRSLL